MRLSVLLGCFVVFSPLALGGCSRSSSTVISTGQGGQTIPGSGGIGSGGQGSPSVGGSTSTGGQKVSDDGGIPAVGGQSTVPIGGSLTGGQAGQVMGGVAAGGWTGTGTGGAMTGGRIGTGGVSSTGGTTTTLDAGAGGMTGGAQGSGGSPSIASGCCTKFGSPTSVGKVASSGLSELSGLVASRAHPGVLYAHADSGAGAIFYAMTVAGASLGSFTLSGVSATDWEDISVGPGPTTGSFIYVGDTGDNAARTGSGSKRTEIQVYRVPEPEVAASASVGAQTLSNWQRLRFTYPDAAHDAETLMVDPVTADILIVTKETSGASKIFRAPVSTPTDTPTVLELVATLSIGSSGEQSALVTAGDISPSGDSVILRSYTAIWLWCRASTWARTFAVAPSELPSASEPKGEGLTFSYDGKAWYSAGETSTTIYQASSDCSS